MAGPTSAEDLERDLLRNEDRNLEGVGSLGRDKLISLIFETL
jgi:hypothetical protein